MKSLRIFLCLGLIALGLFAGLPANAQIDNMPIIPSINVPINQPQGMSGMATEMLDDGELPSRDELRLLGLSEEEIDLIYDNLEEPDALDSYQAGQEALREPTPVQGDGGVGSSGTTTSLDSASQPVDALANPRNIGAAFEEAIYGHRYFRTISAYKTATGDRAPANYILKPGDEVTISAYGRVDFQGVYTINEDGYIFQKEAGRVYLKGMQLGDAKVLLRNRFGRFIDLRGSQFDVAVTYSPLIRVNIVGEVANPGTYNISSWNSAFNALAVANGPTDLGSVRRIEVRRGGETIKMLDLYQFLMDPASNQDFFLQDNDYLVVPSYRKVATVEGQVKRPHTYELLDGEQMTQLIEFAGGLLPAAYSKNVQVERFRGSQRVILDVNLDSLVTLGGDFKLFDGDLVRVDTIPSTIENYVMVRGDVNFPGSYQLRAGYRISDILDKAQGNGKFKAIDQAYLIRLDEDYNPRYIPIDISAILEDPGVEDNVLLEERDIIEVIGKEFLTEDHTVSIEGSVKSPGEFTYAKGMTLKDLLFYAGGPKTEAALDRIEVSRIVEYDASNDQFRPTGKTDIQTVAIGFDLKNDAAAGEYLLQPFDAIYVHKAEGFNAPEKVTISGEVRFPGVYTLDKRNMTVVDLIARAGGLTDAAFAEGANMRRYEALATTDTTFTVQRQLVLELEQAMNKPESPFNHVLQPGDMVEIPKTMDYVELRGMMSAPSIDSTHMVSVPFEKGKRAGYYINQYGGGFSKRAKKNRTLVIEPNGRVRRTKEIFWINIYPKVQTEGAQVLAVETDKPVNEYSKEFEKKPFDWNVFVSSMSAGILSFATIYALVNRTNN